MQNYVYAQGTSPALGSVRKFIRLIFSMQTKVQVEPLDNTMQS